MWDEIRPDFITTEHTPTLAQLARHGVAFANHYSIYCNATKGANVWHQHLLNSTIDLTICLDEENGGITKSK